jgi:HK97 family phage portal protein
MLKNIKDAWTTLLHGKTNNINKDYVNAQLNNTLAAIIDARFEVWNISDPSDIFLHPVVNRATQFIAYNIAQLPLKIYRGEEEYKGTPQYDIYRPNDYQSFFDFILQAVVNKVIYNEIIIRRITTTPNSNITSNLYVYNSSDCKATLDTTGRISTWDIHRETVPASDIIYIPGIKVKGLRPPTLLDILKQDFMADVKSSEFVRYFFENFAQLGGYLYYDGDANGGPTPDQMKAMVDQLNQRHQGSDKSYKLAGLTNGVKYQPLQQSLKDMDFNISKDAIRDRILLHMGVPKSVVGVTDSVDRAVAETHLKSAWQYTLKPLAEQLEISLNRYVYTPMGLTCAWDYSEIDVLQSNYTELSEQATKYLALGYTRNEINNKLKLEMPEDDEYGDVRFIPANLIPISDATIYSDTSTPPEKNFSGVENKDIDSVIKDIETKDAINKSYIGKFDRIQRKHEAIIKNKIKKHLYYQRASVLKAIEELSNKKSDTTKYVILQSIKEAIDKTTPDFIKDMEVLLTDAGNAGIELANDRINTTGGLLNNDVVSKRANLLRNVDDTTYKTIRSQVVEGIKLGETTKQISDRVRNTYNMSSYRSTIISRTESSAMINGSSAARYKEAGLKFKSWSTPKSRESHFKNHDQGVIPFDSQFQNGQSYPGDGVGGAAENVSCSCCIIPEIR